MKSSAHEKRGFSPNVLNPNRRSNGNNKLFRRFASLFSLCTVVRQEGKRMCTSNLMNAHSTPFIMQQTRGLFVPPLLCFHLTIITMNFSYFNNTRKCHVSALVIYYQPYGLSCDRAKWVQHCNAVNLRNAQRSSPKEAS